MRRSGSKEGVGCPGCRRSNRNNELRITNIADGSTTTAAFGSRSSPPAPDGSPTVFKVQNMKTPLLIEVGDADGTAFWHQGVELYNLARRAKKDVVLLNYSGEDHGLPKKANQIDYQRCIVQWFGQAEGLAGWSAIGRIRAKRVKSPSVVRMAMSRRSETAQMPMS